MQVNFKHSLGDRVEIAGLPGIQGTVVALWFGDVGCQYLTSYFLNNVKQREYFLECELSPANKNEGSFGFPGMGR